MLSCSSACKMWIFARSSPLKQCSCTLNKRKALTPEKKFAFKFLDGKLRYIGQVQCSAFSNGDIYLFLSFPIASLSLMLPEGPMFTLIVILRVTIHNALI